MKAGRQAANRNPEAPIFAHADVAMVGDLRELSPAIPQDLQETAGKSKS